LRDPPELSGRTIIVVAAVGVVVNTLTALLFLRGRKHDLNIRGAYLHMTADAGVSLAVVLAGIAMMWFGWRWIDPVASLAIAAAILLATWGLLRESLNLAMHAVPEGIDPAAVREYLAALPGVEDVHDLHIWAMSTTETALTAHLVRPQVENDDLLLARIQHELHDRFGILHATIQVERARGCNACASEPGEVP
jgi:cobalt-zinc-cadmium efflux system protein